MNPVVLTLMVLALAGVRESAGGDTWPQRGGNPQATNDAGFDPGIVPANVQDLRVVALIPTLPVGTRLPSGPKQNNVVNHSPVITRGLLFFGDWGGVLHVVDVANGNRLLLAFDTATGGAGTGGGLGTYVGIQSSPVLAEVSVPPTSENPDGEELRIYFGANSAENTLWCLNVDAIDAARAELASSPLVAGRDDLPARFACARPDDEHGNPRRWPITLASPEPPISLGGNRSTLNGSPLFRKRQRVRVGNGYEERDVLFTPSTGLDCSNGQFYAIDAYTGERLWSWDPVVNGDGNGGVIWTFPAMSADGKHLYVTTGDCVQKPQVGEKAESLVSLNPEDGTVRWWHQRRLVDVADLDIGNGPTVVDVPDRCHLVVTPDKDGCLYAFPQETTIPAPGDLSFDPLRPFQQAMSWRTCFVPGSLNGGFNASGAVFHYDSVANRGYVFAQASFLSDAVRVPGDDANAFAVDACTGTFLWASSSITNGRGEGVVVSGMYFQAGHTGRIVGGQLKHYLQVVAADGGVDRKPELLASIELPAAATQGGGGLAVADGTLYVPVQSTTASSLNGIAVVKAAAGGPHSPPVRIGTDTFKGPYPEPIAPGLPGTLLPPVDPTNPYPLF
jgi:outer membrane protein assembly factor BamB